ncbi:MAG: hypothetical protein WC866_05520 [Patescibacteria group bacterium]
MKNTDRTDRKPRMLEPDVHAQAFKEDAAAREIVFTLGAPKVVIIKINSKNKLGLPEAEYVGTRTEKLEEHQATAERFGIDAQTFCDKQGHVHNGQPVYSNEARVRLGQLLEDLKTSGYKYVAGRWRQKKAQPNRRAPDPTLEFVFSLEGTEIEMSDHVRDFLTTVYVDGFFHWANPKMTADGTPWRLDTLNGFSGQIPSGKNANTGYVLRLDPTHPSGYNLE